MTSVAVVIPTYERAEDLAACLDSIAAQTYPVRRVSVVDNSPAASAGALVASRLDTGIDYHHNASGNSGTEARNRGIRASDGDVVIILDDDVVLEPSYLAEVVRVFEADKTVMGVQGVQTNAPSSSLTNLMRRVFLDYHRTSDTCRVSRSLTGGYPRRLTRPIVAEWLPGFNQAFRRRVLEDELFDTRLSGYADGEDMDLSYRVERRWPGSLRITPAARLEHRKSAHSRMAARNRILMQEVHEFYLRHKLQHGTIADRMARGWTRLGRLIVPVVAALSLGRPGKLRESYFRLIAYCVCFSNARAIRDGDLVAVLGRYGKREA